MLHHAMRTVKPPTVSFITTAQATVSGTTYTFSNVSIGSASSDRIVVVNAGAIRNDSNGNRRISSATIAGTTANIIANTNVYRVNITTIFYLPVASGTTATIAFTCQGDSGTNGVATTGTIGVYVIRGAISSIPVDSDNDATSPTSSITLNANFNGVGIFNAGSFQGTGFSFTGATENYDIIEATNRRRGGATLTTNSTSVTVSSTVSGSGATCLLSGATWR